MLPPLDEGHNSNSSELRFWAEGVCCVARRRCHTETVRATELDPSGTGLFTSHIPNSLETVVKKHKRTASLFEKKTSVREK